MKKKLVSYAVAGALSLGLVGAIPALADDVTKDVGQTQNQYGVQNERGKGFRGGLSEELAEQAQQFGLQTEGKARNEVMQELRTAQLKEQADKYGIEVDGKDRFEVMQEIRLAELTAEAKKYGISVEGKEQQELAQEVREQQVLEAAKALEIDTEGKSYTELMQELRYNHADELAELGILPQKGQRGFGQGNNGMMKGANGQGECLFLEDSNTL